MSGTRHVEDPQAMAGLGWLGILRLGLVQTALGAIVVLTTSTLNRVMVVEWGLAAMVPGALVALHYAVQISRPKWGHGSDIGGRRTPWIVGGMAVLGAGGVLAAAATAMMGGHFVPAVCIAAFAFVLVGFGVGASGTSLLALLATCVDERRRAAAATIVWLMMIFGIAFTAKVAGSFLDPFSPGRLIAVSACVSCAAFALTLLAVWGVERAASVSRTMANAARERAAVPFRAALREVWADSEARRFTIFVFTAMLAYNTQDLILEPFAGLVFGLTPGESTRLAGDQHAGVFIGMVLVAIAGSAIGGRLLGSLKLWTVGGCVGSACALFILALSGFSAPDWPLRLTVFALGFANGAFAVAAIGSMMALAGAGQNPREGTRIGLWGAAQALGFGIGGFGGTLAVDAARQVLDAPAAYAVVFTLEGCLFLIAALLAVGVSAPARQRRRTDAVPHGLAAGDD